MFQDYPDYRNIHERLSEWRTEILSRMDRDDELSALPTFPRCNLAREAGVTTAVDSFLGTANTRDLNEVYFDVPESVPSAIEAGALTFHVEDPSHPVLRQLRDRFDLAAIAGEGSDVDRAIRVRDWIKSLFAHLIPFRMPEWNALLILDRGSRGVEQFICIHYSISLVQCCLALGMQARMLNLHRGISDSYRVGDEAIADPPVDEHVVIELWSRDLRKWVMLDTDFDCHYTRDGTPLSAWEIHRAFVDGGLEQLSCVRGPYSASFTALGDDLPEEHFFAYELPSYYAHVSVLMRNDFLSDQDGPVTVAHPLDGATEPILWHRGSDNRLQPHLMGPVVVATPWTAETPVLTDGNRTTGWASADTPSEHTVEVSLAGPRLIGRCVLHWPEYGLAYRTSTAYRVDAQAPDGTWSVLVDVVDGPETPYTILDVDPVIATRVRLSQQAGGGSADYPDRLWLTQVELYAPTA